MAQGDISQRISLDGDDEVRRKLDAIGRAGEQAFGGLSRGATGVIRPLENVNTSAGRVRGAVTNLSFQVNDLVTGFASGAAPMQVFAQQGGQIFQAFQQGGGLSAVLGGVANSIRNFITPMRALAGVGAAAAAGVALLGSRALSADDSIKQFKVTLDALRPPAFLRGGDALKGFGVTPEQLEETAKKLRSVGLSLSAARAEILEVIRAGIDPRLSEQVIKFGKDLDAAFGEKGAKSADAFKKAIAGGPAELRKFGQEIGVINPNVSELQDGLRGVESLLRKIIDAPSIKGAADKVLDPISKQTRDINVEFQNILDKMSAFFKEGFVNLVSTAGAGGNLAGALSEVITQFGTDFIGQVKQALSAAGQWDGTFAGFTASANAAVAAVQGKFTEFSTWFTGTLIPALGAESAWQGFVSAASSAVENVKNMLAGLQQAAADVATAIANAFRSAGNVGSEVVPGIVAPQFAGGGMVRGPGTGTSDSIMARLSTGEFVVNALSTARFLPLLRIINDGLSMPLVPRTRFATGGLVMAGAGSGGTPVHLHLDGQSFAMNADRDVADSLLKTARAKQLLSAGRKPGWAAGRRYGG